MSKNCKAPTSQSKSSQHPERRRLWDPDRELPRHLGYKLIPCKYCNRTFFSNRLDVHEEICRVKRLQPKRPVFDSVRSRLTGTVAESFLDAIPENEFGRPLNPNWRESRMPGIAPVDNVKTSVKAAKRPNLSSLTNYVQCPICGRRFNPDVGLRHIAHCTTYVCNLPASSTSAPYTPPATSGRTLTPTKKVSKIGQVSLMNTPKK